jgi:DNA-binding GntR family transcriptional regulator
MRQIKSFRSKNELVYASLRSAIVTGELPPGARLVIDELAGQLGVSQIPVREALRQLEADGFVVIRPYVGATVTELHFDQISEIFGLLEAMEIISGRAACARLTASDIDQLARLLAKMDTLVDSPTEWSVANVQFHSMICEMGGTSIVRHMMDKAFDHWDRLRSYFFKGVFAHRVEDAQREHHELFAAMQADDADAVESMVRMHNRAALTAYTDYLANHSQQGDNHID